MRKLFICFLCTSLFYSCSKVELITPNVGYNLDNSVGNMKFNDSKQYKTARMNASQLSGIHTQISSDLTQPVVLSSADEMLFNQELYRNVAQLNTFGFSNFYSMSGLSTKLIIAFDIYKDNQFNPNVYDLISNSVYLNEKQANQLFLLIEVESIISNNLIHNYRATPTSGGPSAFSCGLAVAASIVTTVSAVTIATPLGLGIWLVSKTLATVAVVDGCA